MGDLSAHFSAGEFVCRCGHCNGTVDMQPGFIAKLEEARVLSNVPYSITSGYRCPEHPETLKRPTSSHPKGLAADIHTPTSAQRYAVLYGLIRAGFVRLGIGNAFIHVDLDEAKAPRVCWDYYE